MIKKTLEFIQIIGYLLAAFIVWAVFSFGGTIISTFGFIVATVVLGLAFFFSPLFILYALYKIK